MQKIFKYKLLFVFLVWIFSGKEAAKSLNMKSIFAYQRLESGKTANPELVTIVKVKKVFPELDIDDLMSA